ncbi:Ribonuclease H2 subunit B [Lachnellula willkommii]|uniref:Ribonuclease H2 subunit B n=1 Tax=Lachnellula willkommii TaxID=215461 RepID=A0A559M164_9HELO|nr:Ribonuclease H2 subunit B [Lachnellula willkommii]
MKTRGRPSTKAKKETTEVPVISEPKTQLGPNVANPPQLFILPEDISKDARIVSLENPRSSNDSRYLVCPERGFYEFTKVAAPRSTPRSLLLSSLDAKAVDDGDNGVEDSTDKLSSSGYIMRDAGLFVATPVDPLFFVLPVLAPVSASKSSDPPKKLFLSGEDYLDKVTTASPHLSTLLSVDSLRASIEKRMAAVCDTVDAGDETMYRLSEERMMKELLKKAKKMSEKGLPASMEDKFIRKALEVPIMSIKREESSLKDEDTPADTADTQTSTDTAASSFSEASTAATSFSEDSQGTAGQHTKTPSIPPINAPDGVVDLLRLRTALFFICSNYIAPHLSETIKKLILSPTSTVDFAPLEAHLVHLAKLRQEALAARQLGSTSQKRSLEEDEDGESRAEKKRKLEEEEKRKKAGESRGVKNLKKVNTTGMKKMSDFFKKK